MQLLRLLTRQQPQQSALMMSSSLRGYATKVLFVGNLAWSVRADDLGTLFSQYGEVKSARVLADRESGRSRGFGFVEMEDADAQLAIEKLNGHMFKGRDLRVNESEPKPEGARGGRPGRDSRSGDF